MKTSQKRIRTTGLIQERARMLRQEMTSAEKLLWAHLRDRQLEGLKFYRQRPLRQFIADFYCAASRLVIEIDGGIHDTQPDRDEARTEELERLGYRVIRFQNEQVLHQLDQVLAAIQAACLKNR